MAALLAIGFASATFAEDEGMAPPPPKKARTTPKLPKAPATPGSPKPQKWSAETCKAVCTKAACKGLTNVANLNTPNPRAGEGTDDAGTPTAAQAKNGLAVAFACAENCKAPGKARTMGDCLPGAYEANKCKAEKRDPTCVKLSNGMSSIVMDGYTNRDNPEDSAAQAYWEATKNFDIVTR